MIKVMRKQATKAPNVLHTFLTEISTVARNHRFLTIAAHGVLELLVNVLIEHHCKHGKKIVVESRRDYSHSVKLVILNEKGVIDDPTYKLLNAFRDLRNKSVHTVKYEVTEAMLQPFKSVSLGVKSGTVPANTKAPDDIPLGLVKNYPYLCAAMVLHFWNQNEKVFTEYFEEAQFRGQLVKTT